MLNLFGMQYMVGIAAVIVAAFAFISSILRVTTPYPTTINCDGNGAASFTASSALPVSQRT